MEKMNSFNNHTFVICAYNKSQFLEECVKSLKKQTIKSNIIMITSTPNEYIKSISDKYNIKLFINNGEKGIGQDWNFGVSKCDTDYVTVAHQDDIYNENYLEEIFTYLNKKKDFVIAFSKYNEIKNGKIIPLTKNLRIKELMLYPFKFFRKAKWVKRRVLSLGDPICCPSVTINKKIVGKTPYLTKLKCNLDWATWLEFTKYKGRFLYIPKYLMCHRIHEESETSNLIESNIRFEEDLYMFKKFWPDKIANMLCNKYKRATDTNKV